jgi:alpha-L-fucosidase
MFTDIIAKGGNLLLNVGPRGVDAQIPDEQLARLDWLGQWVGPNRDAIAATRPWVTPGDTTAAGDPVRFTARDDAVHAFLRDARGSVALPDIASTPNTEVVTVDGTALRWHDSPSGITIELPAPAAGSGPTVVALQHVEARGTGR